MKPDWEGIAISIVLLAGVYACLGLRWTGAVGIALALILARGRWNRARS